MDFKTQTTMDVSSADLLEKEFECVLCPFKCGNLRALRGHAKDHVQTSPPYKCHICQFSSNKKTALHRHIRTHKGAQPYKCRVCNNLFSTKSNCKRHMIKNHGISSGEQVISLLTENQQTPEDDWTPLAPAATAGMDKHVATPIVNPIVLALLSRIKVQNNLSIGVPPAWNPQPILNQDQLLASGADLATSEDFPLDLTAKKDEKTVTNSSGDEGECNESTTSEEDHEDNNGSAAFFVETVYSWKEGEEKVKRAKTNVSGYARAPNKVECPVCKVTFPWSSSLKRHLLVHTGEKPFDCNICHAKFSTKSNCLRHQKRKHSNQEKMKSTSKDSLFKCDICSKKFRLQCRKDQHMKLHCLPRLRSDRGMEA